MNKKLTRRMGLIACSLIGGIAVFGGVNAMNAAAEGEVFANAQIDMIKGASVRYYAGSATAEQSGIRFSSVIDSETYGDLEGLENDTTKVSYGMLIAPYSYFKTYGAFNAATVFGVDGEKKYTWEGEAVEEGATYTKIAHVTYDELIASTVKGYEGYHEIKGSLVKIKPENLTKEFVGCGYIKYETEGGVAYKFASYFGGDVENNVRSIVYVSQLAIDANDASAEWVNTHYVANAANVETTYTVETYVGETLVKSEDFGGVKVNEALSNVEVKEYEGFTNVSAETSGKVYANGNLVLKHVYEEQADTVYQVKNGGFETGDLTDWTLTGNIGAVSNETHYWKTDELAPGVGFSFGLDGAYMFSAYAIDDLEGNRGVLESAKFTVSKGGWITYKLGGAKNSGYVHMDVVEAATGKILKRYYNQNHKFEVVDGVRLGCELNAYKANLSDCVGKEVYLRIVDSANTDFGLFFLDSVDTLHLAEPVGSYVLANEVGHEETIYDLYNGNFDQNMDGWKKSSNIGDISEETNGWWGGPFNNVGKYLSCYAGDQAESSKGEICSNVFEIGGCGWITFRLGAMKNYDQVYMEVIDAETGAKYAHFYNEYFYQCELMLYKADLSAYIGKNVYLRFVDNAEGDYGLIFCDEFKTYYTSVNDLPAAARKASNCLYNVANGSFEGGTLTGWTVDGAVGFICGDTTYWADGTAMQDQNGQTLELFHKEGDRFYHSNDGETGVLKSNVFTLAGDGIISFKLGGTNLNDSKVEIRLKDGTVIATVTNDQFHDPRLAMGMLRRFVNLKNYVGQEIFIQVVDGKPGGVGIVTIDSVVASMTMEEAEALLASDKAAYSKYRQDVLDSNDAMGEHAKAIVEIIQNYYNNLTIPTV